MCAIARACLRPQTVCDDWYSRARCAVHPAQVAPIHEAYAHAPSDEQIADAERIVAAFEEAKGGVALLDGKLVERPVILSAQRVLATAGR